MNNSWYCRIGTQVQGPFEFDELQALVAQGKLGGDDEVRTSRSYEWSRAETVPDLIPPEADIDDLTSMLSNQSNGPSRGRRRAKRVSLCYVRIGDDVRGPIPFEELGQMVRSGDLRRGDQVRLSAQAEWAAAASIVGLFESQVQPAVTVRIAEAPRQTRPSNLVSDQRPSPVDEDDPDRTWHWEAQQCGVSGPLTFEQVFALARNGRIERTDKLRAGLVHPWVRADSIVGLFPDAEPVRAPNGAAGQARPATVTPQPAALATVAAPHTAAAAKRLQHAKPAPVAATIAPARRAVVPARPSVPSQPPSPAPVARPAPPPVAAPPAAPRPAPVPKPVPRAAAPVFAPIKRRRTFDFGALFAGMNFSFGAKHAATLAVVVVGGLLWQFDLPSFSFGIGGGSGPTAEAQTLCMELITLSDQDVISDAAWEEFKGRALPKVKELATALEQEGDDSEMLRCCRDYLPKILEAGLAKRPPEWDKMVEALSPT